MVKNPYKPLTKEEKELREKALLEKDKYLKETQELANKCLHNPDFVKYKENYEKLERATINVLIDYVEPDPIKYAFEVSQSFRNLYQLRLLLRGVEADNREKKA